MGHFVSGCACPGTDEVCFSGRSRFSPHTSPQRPGAHHRIKSVPKGCAACIGKCRSKGFGAFPNKRFAKQNKQMYIRLHCLPRRCFRQLLRQEFLSKGHLNMRCRRSYSIAYVKVPHDAKNTQLRNCKEYIYSSLRF